MLVMVLYFWFLRRAWRKFIYTEHQKNQTKGKKKEKRKKAKKIPKKLFCQKLSARRKKDGWGKREGDIYRGCFKTPVKTIGWPQQSINPRSPVGSCYLLLGECQKKGT